MNLSHVINLRVLFVLSALLGHCAPGLADDVEGRAQSPSMHPPGNTVLGSRIAEGVHWEGEIWLRGAGGLISLDLANGTQTVHFKAGVLDITKAHHALWVLKLASDGSNKVTVYSRSDRMFQVFPVLQAENDEQPVALLVSSNRPVILTRNAAFKLQTETGFWQRTPLSQRLNWSQLSIASPNANDDIYIASNRGEWGGGLQKLAVETGEVTSIEEVVYFSRGRLSDDQLTDVVFPATGVIPDPANDVCVLVSVGLSHMLLQRGHVLRVCGEHRIFVFRRNFEIQLGDATMPADEPLYGLAKGNGSDFWAIGTQHMFRFHALGVETRQLGECELLHGVCLSRDLPGVVIVRTDINWSMSLSGFTPLLISTE